MDIARIKNLVKQNGDKVILVENDEPEIVMMSFAEYARITGVAADAGNGATRSAPATTEERLDMPMPHASMMPRMPESEDSADMEFILGEERDREMSHAPVRLADIRLEDLPI